MMIDTDQYGLMRKTTLYCWLCKKSINKWVIGTKKSNDITGMKRAHRKECK